jgi:hypothetical protein
MGAEFLFERDQAIAQNKKGGSEPGYTTHFENPLPRHTILLAERIIKILLINVHFTR